MALIHRRKYKRDNVMKETGDMVIKVAGVAIAANLVTGLLKR